MPTADNPFVPRLMRIKTDELVADPDWAGTNVVPTEPVGGAAILVGVPQDVPAGLPFRTALWAYIVATDANGALLNPSRTGTTTIDVRLVEVCDRDQPAPKGKGAGFLPAVVDFAPQTAQQLNRWLRFTVRPGARRVTLELGAIANGPGGMDRLEVWYHWGP